MPELPEVETTLRGVAPALLGQRIERIEVREPRLRWPVPGVVQDAAGQRVHKAWRRAKYLLFELDRGGLMWHLGMSGSMRILDRPGEPGPHDHVDLVVESGRVLRFNDPRRFGSLLWWTPPADAHPLLAGLGPEPLDEPALGDHLWRRSRGRRVAVKHFIMDAANVVGVGNIYASEALYRAGIHPLRAAGRIARGRYAALGDAIREVLNDALTEGGTTLRDFSGSDGRPGYFVHNLRVYGRAGEPCPRCARPVRERVIGQRNSYYCVSCQT